MCFGTYCVFHAAHIQISNPGKSSAAQPVGEPELSTPVLSAVPLKTERLGPLSPQSPVS